MCSSLTADKEWSSSLEVGCVFNNSCFETIRCTLDVERFFETNIID
jgi:hypothetical protein